MPQHFDCLGKENLFEDLSLEHYRHQDNGLEVVISPSDESDVIALQIWYRVGSAHEDSHQTGMAHFFEHMMFRGTEKNGLGEFDRKMEELGTPWGTNAFTWKDYTAYVVDIPCGALDEALELEADRMQNLDLTESNIHEERGAVLDEKHRSLNDFNSQRFDAFFEKGFADSSSSWPVLGYEEHIKSYDAASLQKYYKKHYAPDNALIAICGKVDVGDALALVHKHFSSITASGQLRPPLARQLKPGQMSISQPISLSRLAINYAFDASEDPWLWDLVGLILSGTEASLFEQEFVIPAKALSSSYWFCEGPKGEGSQSFIQFSFTLMDGVHGNEITERCRELFDQIDKWLDVSKLEVALVSARCNYYTALAKLDDRASLFGETWIYSKSMSDLKKQEKFYNSVTCDQLVTCIKSLNNKPCFVMEVVKE